MRFRQAIRPSACRRPGTSWLGLAFTLLACAPASGQVVPVGPPEAAPLLAPSVKLQAADWSDAAGADSLAYRPYRFSLFGMPSGFLSDPLDVIQDDDTDPAAADGGCPTPDRLTIALGAVNPFFGFRQFGDPGGVGFYKVHTQVQVFDSGLSGFAVSLQAVTPAGLECNGVAGGRTFLSPSVAWFQDLGDGTAFHAFAGQDIHACTRGLDENLERRMRCGMALSRPIWGDDTISHDGLHLFVELLGRYRQDGTYNQRGSTGELLPGLHWHRGDNWWMSGGLIVPLDSARFDPDLWQITCSWRF